MICYIEERIHLFVGLYGIEERSQIIPRGIDTNFVSIAFWGHLECFEWIEDYGDWIDLSGSVCKEFYHVLNCWDLEVLMKCIVWDIEGRLVICQRHLLCLDFLYIWWFGLPKVVHHMAILVFIAEFFYLD